MAKNSSIIWGIHAGKTGDADALFLKNNVIALGWKDSGACAPSYETRLRSRTARRIRMIQ